MSTTEQLTLPTLDGVEFPDARIQITGGEDLDSANLADHLGREVRIGDAVELTVRCTVTGKSYALRHAPDGTERRVHKVTLGVDVIEPA